MARIFAGEIGNIDRKVIERLRAELPEDFTVLAEINVGRNIDIVVIKPNGESPAVLIAAELKRRSRPLTGQTDGVWKELADDGDWKVIKPSNDSDLNFYWQSVHSADALQRWLWMNQRIFRDDIGAIDGNRFAVWPHLVLYSDAPVGHRLPIAPLSKYGQWYLGIDDWVRHLLSWNPRKGVALHQREVDRIVEAMGLIELHSSEPAQMPAVNAPGEELATVVRDLGERVLALESMFAGGALSAMVIGQAAHAMNGSAGVS